MRSVGTRTRDRASPARSGRPPRETTAATTSGRSAAATSAAAAPVEAPKRPIGSPVAAACFASQSVAATTLRASRPMSKRSSPVRASTRSSSALSRSMRSVPSPACCNSAAAKRLRGLWRLLPLPCAKRTTPVASRGTESVPSRSSPSTGTATAVSVSAACMLVRAREEVLDLGVRRLREARVPRAEREKRFRRPCADNLVRVLAQRLARFGRRDGNSDDDLRRFLHAQRFDGSAHRRAGRYAVIHEDDRLTFDGMSRPGAAIQPLAAVELLLLVRRNLCDRFRRNSERLHDLFVQNLNSAARDRTHRQLGLRGKSELADDEDVEGRLQLACDLETDGNAAPRQCEDDHVVPA